MGFRRFDWRIGTAGAILVFKIVYLLAVAMVSGLESSSDMTRFYCFGKRWPPEGEPVFASHFATWDGAHYLYLSETGYKTGDQSCAFYPLMPLLTHWLSDLTGGNHLIAGLILANGFSIVAWFLLFAWVRQWLSSEEARWTLIWLLAYPGALFFQFVYSESLFLLLVMLLVWSLERRQYGVSGFVAFLLPITRAVGLFCFLPILWHCIRTAPPKSLLGISDRWVWLKSLFSLGTSSVQAQLAENSSSDREKLVGCAQKQDATQHNPGNSRFKLGIAPWWLLVAPGLGWLGYLTLMWTWTGNPFEGFQAQKFWGAHAISNLWNVPKFIIGLLTPTEWHEFSGGVLDRCVFLLLIYCVPILWRLDKGMFVWAWVLGIIPAMSGTFTSYTRFASCAFPLFIALAVFFMRREWIWLKWCLLSVFVVLHGVLLRRFVNFYWAG